MLTVLTKVLCAAKHYKLMQRLGIVKNLLIFLVFLTAFIVLWNCIFIFNIKKLLGPPMDMMCI